MENDFHTLEIKLVFSQKIAMLLSFMKKFLSSIFVFLIVFSGNSLLAKPTKHGRPLKKRALAKDKTPPLVSFLVELQELPLITLYAAKLTKRFEQSHATSHVVEPPEVKPLFVKSIAIPWPKSPSLRGFSEFENVSVEIKSVLPNTEDHAFFAADFPSRVWKKSDALQASVRFVIPANYSFDPQKMRFDVYAVFYGYRPDTHKRVDFLRGKLTANISFPSEIVCRSSRDFWNATSNASTIKVTYQCSNMTPTAVRLTDFEQNCDSEGVIWSFPDSLSLNPYDTKTITGAVELPTNVYKNHSCDLSFLTNGAKAGKKPVLTYIRMSPSVFSLSQLASPSFLALQGDGTYKVQFASTPPNEQQTTKLQIQSPQGHPVRSVDVPLQARSPFQHRFLEKGNELSFTFAPKQAIFAQEKVTITIHYEADHTLHADRLTLLLSGDTHVSNQIMAPPQVMDMVPVKKPNVSYPANDFLPSDFPFHLKKYGPLWIQWRGASALFKKEGSVSDQTVTYNPEALGPAKASWRFLPPVTHGFVDVFWYKDNKPGVLTQLTMPTTIYYHPKPLGLLVNAQMNPGVTLERNPWLGSRLDIAKLWTVDNFDSQTGASRRSRRFMHGVGLSWMMGGLLTSSAVNLQNNWNASTALVAYYEFGGDLTRSQKIGLFGQSGVGWSYRSEYYLQQRDHFNSTYIALGLRFQAKLSERIPGLYFTAGVTAGILPKRDSQYQINFPIGISFLF